MINRPLNSTDSQSYKIRALEYLAEVTGVLLNVDVDLLHDLCIQPRTLPLLHLNQQIGATLHGFETLAEQPLQHVHSYQKGLRSWSLCLARGTSEL